MTQQFVAELNSKMMAGDYTVIDLSGWIFSYKQLGNNLLWFNIAQNINNQSASNRRDQGVKNHSPYRLTNILSVI